MKKNIVACPVHGDNETTKNCPNCRPYTEECRCYGRNKEHGKRHCPLHRYTKKFIDCMHEKLSIDDMIKNGKRRCFGCGVYIPPAPEVKGRAGCIKGKNCGLHYHQEDLEAILQAKEREIQEKIIGEIEKRFKMFEQSKTGWMITGINIRLEDWKEFKSKLSNLSEK